MDTKLLELLVCPVTKGPLIFDRDKQELLSRSARLAYPVRDGIPILLEHEARTISEEEAARPSTRRRWHERSARLPQPSSRRSALHEGNPMSGVAGFTVLIPARLASTRLPDKPLADIAGLPMVVRVAQRALQSAASRCVVAADDARIVAACEAHGVQALLTRTDHASGSDRLAEACTLLGLPDDAVVVNVQGDEPLIDPTLINAVAAELQRRGDCVMSTAAHAIGSAAEFLNPNVVKVVLDRAGTALYFSRAPIAWWRDGMAPLGEGAALTTLPSPAPLRHVGIYAYRAGFLRQFPRLEPAPLEATESLEQLRVLWHGQRIAVHLTAQAPGPGVDTPQDLQRVRDLLAQG